MEFAEIERIVKTDPVLGASALKFSGSAAYGLARPVTSVTHAVTLLGMKDLAKCVTVMALTSATEIALTALSRARAWLEALSGANEAMNALG